MKKIITSIIAVVIILTFPITGFANSGPVFWQGYPSLDVMMIQSNSPIQVEDEHLVFDFSQNKNHHYTIGGDVTATYRMVNPTDQAQSVQMAFPFVGTLNGLLQEDIMITADDQEVPYSIYMGNVVDGHGIPWQVTEEASFDFANILKTITDEPFKGGSFSGNELGKLYTIDVRPTTDQRINFTVDFSFDYNQSKVLTKGFNRYERNVDQTKIAAWCYQPEVLEIYVLGEDIDFKMKAYTDGELKEETDLFTYEISTQQVELQPYLISYIQKNTSMEHNVSVSEIQLYNLHAQTLDDIFQKNMGYSSEDYLLSQHHYNRIITLVYTVEFPMNGERKVSVRYKTNGTFDKTQTSKPLYSFDYLLNPAQNWDAFKNLTIEIIPPQAAPYIVKSSIELQRGEDNIYRASLAELPENDLSFTLYANETITLLDKAHGSLNKRFGYFTPLVLGALFTLGIVMILNKRKIR